MLTVRVFRTNIKTMKRTCYLACLSFALCVFAVSCHSGSSSGSNQGDSASALDSMPSTDIVKGRWSPQDAGKWYAAQDNWLVGCNYIPANAINELEMWQAATFDTARIDLELGWAQSLGFNVVRVFLHNLLWQQDSTGFLKRMDAFLTIANRHGIGAMFVLFDGCWNPDPHLGPQPTPRPYVHNSGWVQAPGAAMLKDTLHYGPLKSYLQGVLTHFRDDPRVKLWDLFNEPDNDNGGRFPGDLSTQDKYKYAFLLLTDTFRWAREVNHSQPLKLAP